MRHVLLPLAFLIASLTATLPSRSQQLTDFRTQAILLKRVIEQHHYAPHPINDAFAERLFNGMIQRLNDEHEFLTTSDVSTLQPHRHLLDDELNGTGWSFLPAITSLYRERLQLQAADNPHKKQSASVEKYVASVYLDVLANAFDPHTEYMPAEEKQQFESSLDTEGYRFGFALQQNDKGDVEIARVMPGSPAWKTGELNSGDVIVKVGWQDEAQAATAEEGAKEISAILARPGTSTLQITVRKANGMERTTSLSREKITNEENIVRGYLLSGARKIGYIYLPDFYTGHDGSNASSANDVAKELVKLKKENIEGLILDLRFNGGGSLQEALDMAGIFIDAGPLCLVKDKDQRIASLKDMNRGTIYDGPVTLLINAQSASASELLAAVLQDYNRAVIIGSPSFGKGSVQAIFPLDTTETNANGAPSAAYVKITTNKFYRVSGTTTQNTGVIPDVNLPDIFEAVNYHESALPWTLPSDTVKKNAFYKPLPALPINYLAEKSSKRVSQNSFFQSVKKYISSFKDANDNHVPSAPVSSLSTAFQVTCNSFDANIVNSSAYSKDLHLTWTKKIGSDDYIEEAYWLLDDLLTANPK